MAKADQRFDGAATVGSMSTRQGSQSVPHVAKVALSADTGAGGVLAWANPLGADILVHSLVLDVTTEADGTPTVDAGVAADGTTSSDTLIDGQAVGSAAVTLSSDNAPGTNGGSHRKLASGEYITVSASADPAGLVGNAYIIYSLI